MNASQIDAPPRPGLRERKKARTRASIQDHALRLFRERGYESTTIEQIAEAAEVSPSTLYSYFPTKADIVGYDDFELFGPVFRAQAPGLTVMQALRAAIISMADQLPPDKMELAREREALMRQVPELRTAMVDEALGMVRSMAELIAERAGRSSDDLLVRTLAGAVIGVWISAWLGADDDGTGDYMVAADQGLALLEDGLRL